MDLMVLKGGTEVKLNLENSKIIIKIKRNPEDIVNDFSTVLTKIPNLDLILIRKILDEQYKVHVFQCVYLCSLCSRYIR